VIRLLPVLTAATALSALLAWRRPGDESFEHAFTHVQWGWTLAAVGLNVVSALAGSLAWDTVIKQAMPSPHPRYRDVLSAFSVGLLGNIVLPGRAGEAARIAVLSRRLRGLAAGWATLVGTVVAYRLLDLVPSLALIVYVLVSAQLPHWALTSFVLFVAVGLALLGVGFVGALRHERRLLRARSRLHALATMAREGLGILRAPGQAASATLYQSVAWLSQLLAVFATLRAFGLELPLSAAALVLALVNLAVLFPFWPGNVGLLQAAVAIPLTGYGVPSGVGVAFGVGLQAIEVSVGVSLGLLALAREGLSIASLREAPTATLATERVDSEDG
jgi:uncharacterized membrane protein YbhN (UPF0104 family)